MIGWTRKAGRTPSRNYIEQVIDIRACTSSLMQGTMVWMFHNPLVILIHTSALVYLDNSDAVDRLVVEKLNKTIPA